MNHILVVDDEATIRESLEGILREEGYAVTTTPSGEEAVVLLRDTPYDVLLLDILLPDRDGLDVLNDTRSLSIKSSGMAAQFNSTKTRSWRGLSA